MDNKDNLTYYDQQRQIISQIPPVKDFSLEGKEEIKTFFKEYKHICLMCREKYDFTTFINVQNKNGKEVVKEIETLLKERGTIYDYSLSPTEDMYLFWIKTNDDKKIHLYVLFNAEPMVID